MCNVRRLRRYKYRSIVNILHDNKYVGELLQITQKSASLLETKKLMKLQKPVLLKFHNFDEINWTRTTLYIDTYKYAHNVRVYMLCIRQRK